MPSIGYTTGSTDNGALTAIVTYAVRCPDTPSVNAVIDAVRVKVKNTNGSTARNIRVGLYTDEGGSPHAPEDLIGGGNFYSVPAGFDGEIEITGMSWNVNSGQQYWLAFYLPNTELHIYDDGASEYSHAVGISGYFPNPFGVPGTAPDRKFVIYGVYDVPTTAPPTTEAPTTLEPTTLAPTTLATTAPPTTAPPPTTLAPTTEPPTTLPPTTLAPTTLATTIVPTTSPYECEFLLGWDAVPGAIGYKLYFGSAPGVYDDPRSPIDVGNVLQYLLGVNHGVTYTAVTAYDGDEESGYSNEVTLYCGVTAPPTTAAPTTLGPTTEAPTSAPTTLAPTAAPTTLAPTEPPTTLVPTTLATTAPPTTVLPTTLAPTPAPTTLAPTTLAPTTEAPVTPIVSTLAPTTEAPTVLPTTVLPTTVSTTAPPALLLRGHNRLGQRLHYGWR